MQPLTGRALRDRTIRDYRRTAERAGQVVDAREIERLAIHDCQVYDAVMREARPVGEAKPDPEAEVKREAALDEMAAAEGVEIDHGQVSYQRAPISRLHTSHVPTSRAAYATARIQRIISGATADRNPVVATSTCEIPHLALEVYRLFAQVATRGRKPRPGDETNPYHGRSNADVSRMIDRAVEDICDRSSGRLGPWWVPK